MRRSPRTFRLILGPLMVVALAAGCSGAGGDGATQTAAEDAGPPQPGGVYRTTSPSDPPTLDPHKESNFNTHVTVGLAYSKLVDYKTGSDLPYGSEELEGDLAESWEASDDGMTWTFHLRQGVQFHDVAPVSGREFTSADVVCTLDRIRDLPGQQSYLVSMVDSWEATDPYTVVFNLAEPYAAFDRNLAGHFMWMLPCEGTQGQYDVETTVIGTGPFILESWVRDKERVYVKNPAYYEEGKPYLDGIHYSIVKDEGTRVAAFRTGEIDALGLSDEAQIQLVQSTMEDVVLTEELGYSPQMVYMNQAEEPFDDPRVRRAVALAIDRESMMGEIRPGETGGALSAPVTPKLFGALTPEESAELQPYDPEQAEQLLAEAGYPDGFDTTLMITDGYGTTVVNEAQWVQQDLAEVGIDAEIDVQDYATYFTESWTKTDYAMGQGPQTPFLTADEYLSSMWKSDGPRNWFNINDPDLDAMIVEQRQTLDEDARETLLQDIQRYIIEEVSNPVFLYVSNGMVLRAAYVHNYHSHPDYGQRHMKDVWLGPEAPDRA